MFESNFLDENLSCEYKEILEFLVWKK